jgi:ferritin-like metal-binding protein YciE
VAARELQSIPPLGASPELLARDESARIQLHRRRHMPQMETLHDAFLDELRDAYDAEKQLLKALPKMAKATESDQLRTAFQTHLQETEGHVERLEQVFGSLDERVRGKHCDGMAGIIEEGKTVIEEFEGPTLDACLIASAQRAEHYEMAAYGTLVAWARAMGHEDAAGLLQQILDEEKATDEKLTQIAESGINSEAARAAHGEDEDEAEGASGLRGVASMAGRSGGVRIAAATSGTSGRGGATSSTSRSSRSSSGSRSKSSGSRSGGKKKR